MKKNEEDKNQNIGLDFYVIFCLKKQKMIMN